jgi:thiol-disulfide isomerase/thioredoxin
VSEQDEKRQDEAPADEPPAAGRRVPLATVVIATLLSLAIAGLVAGLLLGVGEKKDDPNIVTLDNDVATVPSLGEGEDTVGRPAPTSDYTTFDGEEASVADYAGTPMVVNFFASWCVPCVREMPAFEQVHQDVGDQVAFVGVNVQDSETEGQAIVDDTGITYDVGRDPDGSLLASFGGVAMPTTVLVDADGTIVRVLSGATTAEELRAAIDEDLLS